MAATVKSAPVVKTESAPENASESQAEINMVVSDTEDDEEFLGDDVSSFDEGAAPPEKDNPDLIILNRKIQEIEEAKKWKGANPGDPGVTIKRPETNPMHPNVYFDKYMGMKKLKAVEQKLKFARGVLRRFSGKDPKTMRGGNRVKLQRAEKILFKVVADHKGEPYIAPKHDVLPCTLKVEDLENMNFRARNRIIIAANKFIPKIEAKPVSERTPWEEVNYPFYKEVTAKYPEPVKASPEEIQVYNKKKNAIKAERKNRHKEDQLDKALNFIDYLLKYKDQSFTPMTRAKLERSFEVIQKQFKFQAAHKIEASKTQPTITPRNPDKNQGQQKQQPVNKPQGGNQQQKVGNNQLDNRKRPNAGGPGNQNRGGPPKIARNNDGNFNNRGNFNNQNNPNFRRGPPNQNFGSGNINRVADIWSSVGAALNQLTSNQNNFNNNQGGNFGGNNQPDNFRRGGGGGDQGRDNFNNNISDMLFNRGGGGGNIGFNDGGRRFDDNLPVGRNDNFNDSRRMDDFNRGGSNFNQGGGGGGNFNNRGNNDFGGNNSYNQMGGGVGGGVGGGGNNYNNGGFNSGGGFGGGLDLNRANRAPMDDLFTRNRSRY